MRLVVTALAAILTALLEVSVAPYFSLGDARPHLVLVFGVMAMVGFGVETGLTWAFVGGVALDVLAGRPLGATAFTLTVVLGAAVLLARSTPRIGLAMTLALVPFCSAVGAALLATVLWVLAAPIAAAEPLSLVGWVAYDAAVGLAVAPLVLLIIDRRAQAGHVYG